MRKRRADYIVASGAASTSDSPPAKRLRLGSTAVHQMIQRLYRRDITEESISQVLTETIEADNPDSKQADAIDLVTKAKAAVPLTIRSTTSVMHSLIFVQLCPCPKRRIRLLRLLLQWRRQ